MGSNPILSTICANDGMVDVAASKAAASDGVWVRVPLCAPKAHTAIFLLKNILSSLVERLSVKQKERFDSVQIFFCALCKL